VLSQQGDKPTRFFHSFCEGQSSAQKYHVKWIVKFG